MALDQFQQRWLAQDNKIEHVLRVSEDLRLRIDVGGPRVALRWFRLGALAEVLVGVVCVLWTGSFIRTHFAELQFVLPAAALHVWLVAAIVIAVTRIVRASSIDYDAPVLEIQRRIEALHVFSMRAMRLLFVFGVAIWVVPFGIVAAQSWFGIDLYARVDGSVLLIIFAATVALGLAALAICAHCDDRLHRSPRLREIARGLSGRNLTAARERLAKLATFEREE
jgi:hypothetical protein